MRTKCWIGSVGWLLLAGCYTGPADGLSEDASETQGTSLVPTTGEWSTGGSEMDTEGESVTTTTLPPTTGSDTDTADPTTGSTSDDSTGKPTTTTGDPTDDPTTGDPTDDPTDDPTTG